jgi:hypothetical protein
MSWKLYQIDRFLISLDFNKSVVDPNLYHYCIGDESLILMTYSEIVGVVPESVLKAKKYRV